MKTTIEDGSIIYPWYTMSLLTKIKKLISAEWPTQDNNPSFKKINTSLPSGNDTTYHLVLSWWWLRGFAHIGVYKALVEQGYEIGSVAGTSMGALVGTFIAAQKTPAEIEEIFTEKSVYKLLDIAFSRDSMFSAKRIRDIVEKKLWYTTFEELPIAMTVCVADYTHGQVLYIKKGEILPYVIASCSIPWVFEPIEFEDKYLVDGWIFDNFPVVTGEGKKIIGSHVNPRIFDGDNPLKDLALRALDLVIARDISEQKKQCEIFFEPSKLTEIWLGLFTDPKDIIQIGYEHAQEILKNHHW